MLAGKNIIPTIKQEWELFSSAIFAGLREPVSDIQREETRRAFYAGQASMFNTMNKLGGVHEPLVPGLLDALKKEFEDYRDDLKTRFCQRN